MFVIIVIITMATMGIMKHQLSYANKYNYYAAFTNFKKVVGEIIAEGSVDTSAQDNYQAALAQYYADLAAYNSAWNNYASDLVKRKKLEQFALAFVFTPLQTGHSKLSYIYPIKL